MSITIPRQPTILPMPKPNKGLNMAKRELYERREVGRNLLSVNRDLVPITEQEIVKPYLEKLKEQIDSCYDGTVPMYRIDAIGIIKLIDNLLSELEKEEQ